MTDSTPPNPGDGPSEWQQRIEGEWFGIPSVFDATGSHQGWCRVNRSSVFEDGETTYYMHTEYDDVVGPLRNRLEVREFAFGVEDSDKNRLYLGPDFVGAGHPYGALVDAHYYSPAWRADLRTMVHLPDPETEVYSSLLYDGPTICMVFNGVYKVAFDYETNEATRTRIDQFLDTERSIGRRPHALPMKAKGRWTGELTVFGADQQPRGSADCVITHEPTSLLRARQRVEVSGDANWAWSFDRYHDDNRHTYDGPDAYGNAIAYGRAAYTSQHAMGSPMKVSGREFLINDDLDMSVVWKRYDGDRLSEVVFGLLTWSED